MQTIITIHHGPPFRAEVPDRPDIVAVSPSLRGALIAVGNRLEKTGPRNRPLEIREPKTPLPPGGLLPIRAAAQKFGYRDAQHFAKVIAPKHGLSVVRVGDRYFVEEREVSQAIKNLFEKANK